MEGFYKRIDDFINRYDEKINYMDTNRSKEMDHYFNYAVRYAFSGMKLNPISIVDVIFGMIGIGYLLFIIPSLTNDKNVEKYMLYFLIFYLVIIIFYAIIMYNELTRAIFNNYLFDLYVYSIFVRNISVVTMTLFLPFMFLGGYKTGIVIIVLALCYTHYHKKRRNKIDVLIIKQLYSHYKKINITIDDISLKIDKYEKEFNKVLSTVKWILTSIFLFVSVLFSIFATTVFELYLNDISKNTIMNGLTSKELPGALAFIIFFISSLFSIYILLLLVLLNIKKNTRLNYYYAIKHEYLM